MIDLNLINISTESAKIAIANCRSTPSDGLFLIDSVFDNTAVAKLKEYTINTANWKNDAPKSRAYVAWEPDTIIEELHEVCNNLTTPIGERFFNSRLNYLGIQIWKDTNKFRMKWHYDNPIINVALQVYMFDTPSIYGTSFLIDGNEFAVPYRHNSGYITINNGNGIANGLKHKPTTETPAGVDRFSVYAIWSLSEKIIKEEHTC
jgi:hypothetical protein